MGGFTDQPLPEPAPDVPPANEFNPAMFAQQLVEGLAAAKSPLDKLLEGLNWYNRQYVKFLVWSIRAGAWLLTLLLRKALPEIQPALNALVEGVGSIMGPGMDVLGTLTGVYVKQFVDQQREIRPGEPGAPPSGLKPAAAGLFDSIIAPLGFLVGGVRPDRAGAGEQNAQYVLGSITAIHLSTWAINIISNLTGFGALKFINSFDDVMTAALSARGLSRMAMKPYVMKFVGDPLERDLNQKLPLDVPTPGTLVKSYIRGAITRDALISKMRGLGFAEEVVEDLLLDTAKLLPADAAVYLVNQGKWTEGEALEHLQMAGWPAELAPVVFTLEKNSLVRAQMRALANSLVSAFEDRRIDNPTLRHLLEQIGFTADEIDAFVTRGAVIQELPRRLTFAQVRALYQEGLIDLRYVETFLEEEGYGLEDRDLLVLLEFTRKEERDARRVDQRKRARTREEDRLAQEQADLLAQQTELLRLSL